MYSNRMLRKYYNNNTRLHDVTFDTGSASYFHLSEHTVAVGVGGTEWAGWGVALESDELRSQTADVIFAQSLSCAHLRRQCCLLHELTLNTRNYRSMTLLNYVNHVTTE